MFCSISHIPPTKPVCSPYGHIYEKSIILQHLKTSSSCPITKKPLSVDQLVDVVLSSPSTSTTSPSTSIGTSIGRSGSSTSITSIGNTRRVTEIIKR